MGRKGGKKYRKELRKEQSERDKDALFWKLGKQLSDPLGEYRKFIANLRNKEINEVDDFIDIPINLVDLTANLITSLITGENCLYESINESDKRLNNTLSKINEDSEIEFETAKITKRNRRKSKSRSRENSNDSFSKEIKLNKLESNSNLIPLKKHKSHSFNFEEYIQQENEESFYFIRKIIKKTQLSLTTFIVSLYFIYNYKHLEKDKRKHRENKVQKYISDWPSPSSKNSNKKKRRKRKNKNKNNESMTESSSLLTDKGTPSSQENIDMKEEIQFGNKNIEIRSNNKGQLPNIEISPHSDTHNGSLLLSNDETNDVTSPILKSGFLSSFQPRRQSSNVSICSSIDSKIVLDSYSQNTTNSLENQYPSPSHTNNDTNNNTKSNVNNDEKNTEGNKLNNQINDNTKDNNIINNQNNKKKMDENNNEILNDMKKKKEEIYNDNNEEKITEDNKINNNVDNEEEEDDDDDNDDDNNDNEKEEEDDDDNDDDNNDNEKEEDDDNRKRERLYQRFMHKRHNSQFSAILKNEKMSKNFSYLSSCYILSDRYGSYVIPTFLASIIVADKLLYDATYTNSNWSEFTEGRYSLEDINELERRFLSIMNFQLFISQKKFDEFLSYLDFILCLQKIRAWGSIPFSLSYSDIYTLTKKIDTKYFNAYPNSKNDNIYETLKFIFKIILGIILIYILLFFIYILWKNRNS